MSDPATPERRPPQISPYLPTLILFALSAWFFYDGWFNPKIESVMFNRIGAPILFGLGIFDYLRMRGRLRKKAAASVDSEPAGG